MIENNTLSKKDVIARELDKWLKSDKRNLMITGEDYYLGNHDILTEPRTVIGDDGELEVVKNLPDSRIVDNQYGRIVDQKVNYSVGKEILIKSEDKKYQDKVSDILDKEFMRQLRTLTINAFNTSIGWLHPHYSSDGKGDLKFKIYDSHEILPFWKDKEHTELDFVVRTYPDKVYEGNEEVDKQRVEIYTDKGVYRYDLEHEDITKEPILQVTTDFQAYTPYISRRIYNPETEKETYEHYDWGEIPLIPFKYNDREIPLIARGKSIQDALNRITSNFVNNTLEDPRNSILVIHNYDGEDLGKFRKNLAQYGAVKVRSGEGVKGGVDVLTVEINPENYKAILNQLKTSLIENLRGVDGKNDKLTSGDVNQMHIQSMYNDIDLDASGLEIEFQASLDKLMTFINKHLKRSENEKEKVEFIFNRDILMNESESIEDFVKSYGRISDETAVANHPWVTDIDDELKSMKDDNEQLDMFMGSLGEKSKNKNPYHDSKKDDFKSEPVDGDE